MKKSCILIGFALLLLACESKKDSCIRRYVDEQGYTYEQAKEMCDEAESDTYGRE